GTFFVKSACSVRLSAGLQSLWVEHLLFGLRGLCLMFLIALTDYRKWIRLSPWAYIAVLIALVLVLIPSIGTEQMGARRWLFGLQPSEPAKLVIVMMLAYVLGRWRTGLHGVAGLFLCVALVGVPAILILAEPDLGTAIVLVPTCLLMLFVANVSPKILGMCVLLGVLATVYVVSLIYVAKAPETAPEREAELIALTGLRPHQVRRVETFLYPMRDLHGSGYNVRQSEIAVGSGGLFGKGYTKGVQNLLGYLPASVSANDFIFPVVAEETGFVGSSILLGLYLLGFLVSGLIIGMRCVDDTGKLLCVGIVSLIFCHVFINIGMTVRIVPITGLPLPFISQGGTFMLVMMMGVGILQSVAVHGRTSDTVFQH
ncbi:MAG: FtsW/RodA/SpoVE family cell cycle protein, partial [Kiritimatiellia bacterium]